RWIIRDIPQGRNAGIDCVEARLAEASRLGDVDRFDRCRGWPCADALQDQSAGVRQRDWTERSGKRSLVENRNAQSRAEQGQGKRAAYRPGAVDEDVSLWRGHRASAA